LRERKHDNAKAKMATAALSQFRDDALEVFNDLG
jgi:hypothetical protein